MKVMFTCQTCGSPVGYDLVAVETHDLRQYGVHRYECVQPCQMCSAPEPSRDSSAFETAEAPGWASAWALQPTGGVLQEAALANA